MDAATKTFDELKEENQDLRQRLLAKEREIQALQDIVDAHSDAAAQDVATGRLAELSKKNRHLNVMMEKYRTEADRLRRELEGKKALTGSPKGKTGGGIMGPAKAGPDGPDGWRVKYEELLQRNTRLSQEMGQLTQQQRAVEVLVRKEYGEEVDVRELIRNPENFKGRQEEIIRLRAKVRDLAAKAGATVKEGSGERAVREGVRAAAEKRTVEMQRLQEENQELQEKVDEARFKSKGQVGRIRVLENSLSQIKEKMAVVLNKTATDDKLIRAQKAQIQALTDRLAGKSGAAGDAEARMELEQRCEEFEMQVQRQERIILALQEQLQAAQEDADGEDEAVTRGGAEEGGEYGGSEGGQSPGAEDAAAVAGLGGSDAGGDDDGEER
ncbi:unnamed protein product [Pedinophyceae sp. YPF-701]|nr:unnamed protein product [Pedinophyceae sp. YPF-701]